MADKCARGELDFDVQAWMHAMSAPACIYISGVDPHMCFSVPPRKRHGCVRNACARFWRSSEAWDISTHPTSWGSTKRARPHRARGKSNLHQVR